MARKKTVTEIARCDVRQLYQMVNDGDLEALEALRSRLQENPGLAMQHGDIGKAARGARLKRMINNDDLGMQCIVQENIEDMIRQLSGEHPTPVVRQLAECACMCWIDLQDHQLRYSSLGRQSTPKEFEWWSHMIDCALRRYLATMKTLANAQCIKMPQIQVNIADRQINTLGLEATGVTQGNRLGE